MEKDQSPSAPAGEGAEGVVAGRPQRLPAARRRHQLLVAATELFGAQGYHGTSMEDIADEAGVTKPVLYQHFPSKRDLYVELLGNLGQELIDAVAAASSRDSHPLRQVRAGFMAYFRYVSGHTAAFQLIFGTGARGTDEFAEVIRGFEDEMAGIVASLIQVAAPGLGEAHRRTLAYAIVGAAEMTARDWVASARRGDAPARARGADVIADVIADPELMAGRGAGLGPGLAPAGDGRRRPGVREVGAPAGRLPRLDPAMGDVLAGQVSDLVWAGLRGLNPDTP